MDWISDKICTLIEEGNKALNREIVVTSDAKEDEVDDGSGAWEEEVLSNHIPRAISHPSSTKHTGIRRPLVSPNTIEPPPPSFNPSSTLNSTPSMPITPRLSHFWNLSPSTFASATPPSTFDQGHDSGISFHEDEQTWESPELRESMERARARAKMNLNLNPGFYRKGT